MTTKQTKQAVADKAQHTPGPWMIFPGGDIGSASVRRPDTVVIRSGTVKGETIGSAMTNARLIAAAPELLEACKRIMHVYNEGWRMDPSDASAVRDAIAKTEIA
jgi:hypothetical protein